MVNCPAYVLWLLAVVLVELAWSDSYLNLVFAAHQAYGVEAEVVTEVDDVVIWINNRRHRNQYYLVPIGRCLTLAFTVVDEAGDVAILVNHFLENICQEYNISPKKIDNEAITTLSEKPWSGNVRELRNIIERLVVLSGTVITKEDIERYC